jgi:hypothetical protein
VSKEPTTPLADQSETHGASLQQIMGAKEFAAGVDDVRSGRPARFDTFADGDWSYERGRLFAMIAPTTMPLRIKGRLNFEALMILSRAFRSGAIT